MYQGLGAGSPVYKKVHKRHIFSCEEAAQEIQMSLCVSVTKLKFTVDALLYTLMPQTDGQSDSLGSCQSQKCFVTSDFLDLCILSKFSGLSAKNCQNIRFLLRNAPKQNESYSSIYCIWFTLLSWFVCHYLGAMHTVSLHLTSTVFYIIISSFMIISSHFM